MTLPTPVKTWSFSLNNRITFVSLNATMAALLFGVKNFLVATMGYTVKYTCDGTTGPTSGSDHTDRWASAANCTTQGASAAAAQSFCVLTDGNGVDILLAYQGASADIAVMAMSFKALFVPAGTANQQPTATDIAYILGNASLINGTASADRIWHAQASSDKTMFRVMIYRSNVCQNIFGVEQVVSSLNSNHVFSGTCVAFDQNGADVAFGPPVIGNTAIWPPDSAGGPFGRPGQNTLTSVAQASNRAAAEIDGALIPVGGGGIAFNVASNANAENTAGFSVQLPELQNFINMTPLSWSAITANFQGRVGDRIDSWMGWGASFVQGDTVGSKAFVFMGYQLWPWDGATVPVTS